MQTQYAFIPPQPKHFSANPLLTAISTSSSFGNFGSTAATTKIPILSTLLLQQQQQQNQPPHDHQIQIVDQVQQQQNQRVQQRQQLAYQPQYQFPTAAASSSFAQQQSVSILDTLLASHRKQTPQQQKQPLKKRKLDQISTTEKDAATVVEPHSAIVGHVQSKQDVENDVAATILPSADNTKESKSTTTAEPVKPAVLRKHASIKQLAVDETIRRTNVQRSVEVLSRFLPIMLRLRPQQKQQPDAKRAKTSSSTDNDYLLLGRIMHLSSDEIMHTSGGKLFDMRILGQYPLGSNKLWNFVTTMSSEMLLQSGTYHSNKKYMASHDKSVERVRTNGHEDIAYMSLQGIWYPLNKLMPENVRVGMDSLQQHLGIDDTDTFDQVIEFLCDTYGLTGNATATPKLPSIRVALQQHFGKKLTIKMINSICMLPMPCNEEAIRVFTDQFTSDSVGDAASAIHPLQTQEEKTCFEHLKQYGRRVDVDQPFAIIDRNLSQEEVTNYRDTWTRLMAEKKNTNQ